jgi:hypothetical protein
MTTTDRTTEPAGVFDAHLARWEAAEADPDGTLERVARAMWIAEGRHPDDWGNTSLTAFLAKQDHLRYLAATAIDALRPAPDAPRVESPRSSDLRAYCYQCHHAWTAHDDGTDDGDYCRVCECDGYVPGLLEEIVRDPIGFAARLYDVPRDMVEGARDHLDGAS